ncbi:hypothetical protein B7494_g5725 [Chlorociboria aeruginascens]|nr:hypothetical protein B7494_g5725 [Chlorociboria aeruginascens]
MSEMEEIVHHSQEGASSGDATTYPLTMDQRILQGDNYRNDHEMLSLRLKALEIHYRSLPPAAHPPHSGLPACERCRDRRGGIIAAYREMYITEEPDRWHSKNLNYRNQVQAMFDQPDEFTLADIYKYSQTELRKHLQRDICSQDSSDSDEIIAYKTKAAAMFDQEINIAEISQSVLELQSEAYTEPDVREFLSQLQRTKTAKDRAPIYAKYYCGHSALDSPQVRNFKNKYGRIFESLVPHDTVVAGMKKEAAESQEKDVSQLRSRLEGLSLAQKANRKKVNKRAEEKGNREDKGKKELSEEPKSVECALECGNEVSTKGEGALQCALCNFLSLRDQLEDSTRKQFFYCSVEHAEEDFRLVMSAISVLKIVIPIIWNITAGQFMKIEVLRTMPKRLRWSSPYMAWR